MTATPIQIDYQGEKKFLIDASVFSGSSGSPVFRFSRSAQTSRDGALVIGGRSFDFLGVVTAVYFKTDENDVVEKPIPVGRVKAISHQMIDVGIIQKAAMIVVLIENNIEKRGLRSHFTESEN